MNERNVAALTKVLQAYLDKHTFIDLGMHDSPETLAEWLAEHGVQAPIPADVRLCLVCGEPADCALFQSGQGRQPERLDYCQKHLDAWMQSHGAWLSEPQRLDGKQHSDARAD